ncbi:MAG: c-type cytochrome [Actinomycetota bacterium]|nr:c-type cytochrome [Actinomycetota bacterium]
MLPVIAFVAFWVVLAFGLFFVAVRGGPAGARAALQTQSRGGRKGVGLILAILYVGFGVAIPIAFLTGNHANASSQIGGIKLSATQKHGRELFGEHCSVCHTLAGANAEGKVGPNLDTIKPPASLVLHTIQYGCLSKPPTPTSPEVCLNQGVMPPNVVQGRDAQDVASFVAKVAGKE